MMVDGGADSAMVSSRSHGAGSHTGRTCVVVVVQMVAIRPVKAMGGWVEVGEGGFMAVQI